MRTITKGSSGRFSATRLKTNEEKEIPPNTAVMVWLCPRMSGSPNGDKEFDKKAYDEYHKTHRDKSLQRRFNMLQKKLLECFFDLP